MYNYICNIVTYREIYPCIHVSMYPIVKLLHREHVLMCFLFPYILKPCI